MVMRVHPNGIGIGYADDQLLSAKPLYTSGNVWYVDSAIGVDALGPQGMNPATPYATLGHAVTISSPHDLIVLMANHTETLVAGITIPHALVIVGQGRVSGSPSVTLRSNVAGATMIEALAAPCEFRNINFGPRVAAAGFATLDLGTAPGSLFVGCRFEVGDEDTGNTKINMSPGEGLRFVDCWFGSVGTDPLVPPYPLLASSEVNPGTVLQRCTFSAGTTGFALAGYAANFSGLAHADLVMEDLTLQGADIIVHTSSTGRFNIASSTGAARVLW